MIFDNEHQRKTILELIDAVNWPGSKLEQAIILKTQVKSSVIMSFEDQVQKLGIPKTGPTTPPSEE